MFLSRFSESSSPVYQSGFDYQKLLVHVVIPAFLAVSNQYMDSRVCRGPNI